MMKATYKPRRALILTAIIAGSVGSLWAETASAQMFREPFSFEGRNRASMAVYMHQQGQDNGSTAAALATAPGDSQALVCAGNGQTSATAAGNIMCVIAGSNTNVLINSDQNSNGDQNADAETNQTAADEISQILDGDTNG